MRTNVQKCVIIVCILEKSCPIIRVSQGEIQTDSKYIKIKFVSPAYATERRESGGDMMNQEMW